VIILDTHIWIKWVFDESQLPQPIQENISKHEAKGLGVSVISCWEVAKLIELKRLKFELEISDWIEQALSYPGIQLI
jgi:PIN domain nuclease of toxin-antitoxin system